MSAKKCAREECGKSVYPIEELKCLDKVWHKQCFKCSVCGMTLNMKNYKGYDKKPYCEPHYPKTVASVVSDTPEMRRIAENTRNQSNVQYHAQYEKMKGTKIEIADDPEMTRHLKNSTVQSQLAYTGELDKRKKMEEVRPTTVQTEGSGFERIENSGSIEGTSSSVKCTDANDVVPSAQSSLIYSSDNGGTVAQPQRSVGSIADYDPLNGNWGTSAAAKAAAARSNSDVRYCVDFTEEISSSKHQQPTDSNNVYINVDRAQQSVNPTKPNGSAKTAGFAVKAIYDYAAADKDEVSFLEGDVIVNCEKVDEGWMTGTVQRTLQWGMLPANYVHPHKLPTGLHRIN